jgi:hypothetical protein
VVEVETQVKVLQQEVLVEQVAQVVVDTTMELQDQVIKADIIHQKEIQDLQDQDQELQETLEAVVELVLLVQILVEEQV